MSSLVSLVLAVHVGTLAYPPPYALMSFRAQARLVAAQTTFHAPPALGVSVAGPREAPVQVRGSEALPDDLGPVVHVRPEEWVSAFADRLEIGRSGLGHAAVWLASLPVHLDVRSGHLSMRITVHTR